MTAPPRLTAPRVIWKYPIRSSGRDVQVPAGALFLSVQLQDDVVTVWMECDPTADWENRRFVVRMTGEEWQSDGSEMYLGTVQRGPIVLHVYEERIA